VERLSIISDTADGAENLVRQLSGLFETRLLPRHDLPRTMPDRHTIVDVDLGDGPHLIDLRLWLNRRPKGGKAIFAVEPGVRRQVAQAYAVGATHLVHRPIDGQSVLAAFWGDLEALAGDPLGPPIATSETVKSGVAVLRDIFSTASTGVPLDQTAIAAAGESIVTYMGAEGLASWVDVVRRHHSQTYQHCLLVTGVAVGFGRQLGLSNTDQRKLSFAGLMHDIGKARIPVALLEKPGPLNQNEVRIMNQHPVLGHEVLEKVPGLQAAIIDAVVHHHEYLDGSGYPHGLQGSEISDLVRILTVSDIFGALIERRSYKAPMPHAAAYRVLLDMGPKLDKDLVREFRPVSQLTVGRT
jgi:putative nucleotidyltransferase with HDIG domain